MKKAAPEEASFLVKSGVRTFPAGWHSTNVVTCLVRYEADLDKIFRIQHAPLNEDVRKFLDYLCDAVKTTRTYVQVIETETLESSTDTNLREIFIPIYPGINFACPIPWPPT